MASPSMSKPRLELLTLLSKQQRTPSELSRLLRRSLPTISRHLAYLESFGLVKRIGEVRGRTRPYAKYALEETILTLKAMEGDVGILKLPVSEEVRVQFRIWSIPQRVFHYYVERFMWQIQDFMPSITAIAVHGSVARGDAREDSDIDLLILANEDIMKIRKSCEAVVIKKPKEESRMAMAQVFEPDGFRRALKAGSKFAREVVKTMLPIYDPDRVLATLRTT